MEEFVTKFVNLQCYAPYLKDGKENVYQFINCLPMYYKDKIEFPRLWMKKLGNINCAIFYLNKDLN